MPRGIVASGASHHLPLYLKVTTMFKKSTSSRPSRKAPKDFPLTRHPRG